MKAYALLYQNFFKALQDRSHIGPLWIKYARCNETGQISRFQQEIFQDIKCGRTKGPRCNNLYHRSVAFEFGDYWFQFISKYGMPTGEDAQGMGQAWEKIENKVTATLKSAPPRSRFAQIYYPPGQRFALVQREGEPFTPQSLVSLECELGVEPGEKVSVAIMCYGNPDITPEVLEQWRQQMEDIRQMPLPDDDDDDEPASPTAKHENKSLVTEEDAPDIKREEREIAESIVWAQELPAGGARDEKVFKKSHLAETDGVEPVKVADTTY